MAFIKQTQQIMMDYANALEEEFAKLHKVKEQYRAERVTRMVLEEQEKETAQHVTTLRSDYAERISKALSSYLGTLPARYTKTAQALNEDDMQLLNSPALTLSASDLEAMQERNRRSDVMRGIIADYASAHGIEGARLTYYTKEARESAARDYANGATRALSDLNGEVPGMRWAHYADAAMVPPELQGE